MFTLGSRKIEEFTVLAPMAGITDLPFRRICRSMGAGLAFSEMLTSDARLWNSRKSRQRLSFTEDEPPRAVQLAGNDPKMMAEAARTSEAMGAQIIDINMGCPAKKVCKKAAGSALLADEPLVAEILGAVRAAVDVPVSLKIRTGTHPEARNGITIAKLAEDSGVELLTVHGRTRQCAFKGKAEYDTIAAIVDAVSIPVIANGDIDSPQKAKKVLDHTGAQAVMLGRGAQGNPWLFREINHYLKNGTELPKPGLDEIQQVVSAHVQALHEFYGDFMGVKIARKHVAWYFQNLVQQQHQAVIESAPCPEASHTARRTPKDIPEDYPGFRKAFNQLESSQEQCDALAARFESLKLQSLLKEDKAA